MALDPHNDESIYELVAVELLQDGPRAGLWAKAFARTGGDDAKTKALYIQWRYDQVKRELLAEFQRLQAAADHEARQQQINAKNHVRLTQEARVSFQVEYAEWITLARQLQRLNLSDAEIEANFTLRGAPQGVAVRVLRHIR